MPQSTYSATNPHYIDLKDQQHHPASGLQADLAAAKEEARKLEAERQQRFRDELSRLDPPERLERAIWLIEHEQVHGPFGTSTPLSSADIAHVQRAFLEHVRETLPGFEEPSERFAYVRDVILDLDLMQDEGDIVRPVREKVVLILESLQDEWAASAQTLNESVKRAQAELEEAERTHSQAQGSATNWRHLARAAVILARHPDLQTRDDFAERALSMQAELGPSGENPGSAIWRGVHRLGKTILESDHLPDRYLRLEGFRRLVFDLIQGISQLRDKKDNDGTKKSVTGQKEDKM